MCTVSYIPQRNKGFVLSSNRDEKVIRNTIRPRLYINGHSKYVFPRDKKANGSWIGMSESGRVCCLLNGAFVKHEKSDKYTYSRGLVLLDVLKSEFAIPYLKEKDLSEVEPFTLIVAEPTSISNALHEFRWDGRTRHHKIMDSSRSHIWSSVTLYDKKTQKLRKDWFRKWLQIYQGETENILNFHHSRYSDNSHENVLMQRENLLQTVSITQIFKSDTFVRMRYHDLLADDIIEHELACNMQETESVD